MRTSPFYLGVGHRLQRWLGCCGDIQRTGDPNFCRRGGATLTASHSARSSRRQSSRSPRRWPRTKKRRAVRSTRAHVRRSTAAPPAVGSRSLSQKPREPSPTRLSKSLARQGPPWGPSCLRKHLLVGTRRTERIARVARAPLASDHAVDHRARGRVRCAIDVLRRC